MTQIDTKLAANSRPSLAFYWLGRNLCVWFCRLVLRMRAEGLENVPTSGPFILAPIHRSNIDTPIAAICTKRRMRYMGKDSLWHNGAAAWLFSSLGGFPVSRGTADREALNRCVEVLTGGEPLVLFPEGERKGGPVVQPLFDGAAYIAARAGVPIVPVGIGGSERVMPKGARMIHPKRVHVIVGRPIPAPALGANGRVPRDAIRAVTKELHDSLQVLFDAAQIKAGT